MRFTWNYLAKFIDDLPKDLPTLQQRFTTLGIEVESVTKDPQGQDLITVALAPNRADLLGMVGIARELSLLSDAKVIIPEVLVAAEKLSNTKVIIPKVSTAVKKLQDNLANTLPELQVELLAAMDCPKYHSRVIVGCDLSINTPAWIAEVLSNAGIKLINTIVDLTNYVMLELGQPLHAFNYDKVRGNLQVRLASINEEIVLLNGQTVKLTADDLVIADEVEPLALAGIMGGGYSAIDSNTSNIILESAYFEPVRIRMSCTRHNISSDAAIRFTRNVDPCLSELAIRRCSQLLTEIVGGRVIQQQDLVIDKYLPQVAKIELSMAAVTELLGFSLAKEKIEKILTKLGAKITAIAADKWLVEPPTWRADLKIAADLIEEIARCVGYNNIVPQKVILPLTFKVVNHNSVNFSQELKLKRCLANRGYNEVINYSFIDLALAKKFYPNEDFYELTNPIANNMSIMRPGLWPGLFSNLLYNQKRQLERVRLFELGTVFKLGVKDQNLVAEISKIAGLISAKALVENWQNSAQAVDFFGLKNDVLALLELYGLNEEVEFRAMEIPALHPAQAASIFINNCLVGHIGALHPDLVHQIDEIPVYVFELDITKLVSPKVVKFVPVTKFPSIRRDFSVILDQTFQVFGIAKIIKDIFKELLKDVIFFDVYLGDRVPEGKKSVAFGVVLQHPDRTLLDQEINKLVEQLLYSLQQQGIELRTQ